MGNENKKWTAEELDDLLKHFLRHVVGFAINYRVRLKNGKPAADGEFGDEQFAFFTCFVIAIRRKWFLVTAGHITTEWTPGIEKGVAEGYLEVTGRSLADYFGTGAAHFDPLPFDFFDQPTIHVFEKDLGLDFAIVPVGDLVAKGLEANKILPLPINWERGKKFDDFYGFGIVGFPGEYSNPRKFNGIGKTGGEVKPVLVPVERQEIPTPARQAPQFVGKILDMGDQKSIVGLSGGPIFGYRDGSQYEVVAIQSMWNKVDTIYGCPLDVVFRVIAASLGQEK